MKAIFLNIALFAQIFLFMYHCLKHIICNFNANLGAYHKSIHNFTGLLLLYLMQACPPLSKRPVWGDLGDGCPPNLLTGASSLLIK